jgi:hypothetical protein
VVVLILVAFGVVTEVSGQQSLQSTEDSAILGVTRRFVSDEAHLWMSPFRLQHDDLKWVVPFGILSARFAQIRSEYQQ